MDFGLLFRNRMIYVPFELEHMEFGIHIPVVLLPQKFQKEFGFRLNIQCIPYFKAMLNLERSSLALNKHPLCKNAKQLGQNQNILICLNFSFASLQSTCSLHIVLEHSKSSLVFEQSRLHNSLLQNVLFFSFTYVFLIHSL